MRDLQQGNNDGASPEKMRVPNGVLPIKLRMEVLCAFLRNRNLKDRE